MDMNQLTTRQVTELPVIMRIREQVGALMDAGGHGHGAKHATDVMQLALKFSDDDRVAAPVDRIATAMAALLHDVDDYKLVGTRNAESLANARRILRECGVDQKTQIKVLDTIATIGYSKRLAGILPKGVEGELVSDADMCDTLGLTGVERCRAYNASIGRKFWDRNTWPRENMTPEQYKNATDGTAVNHMFEKILKLPETCITPPGREEALRRRHETVEFLYGFFREQDAPEWAAYLHRWLAARNDGQDSVE